MEKTIRYLGILFAVQLVLAVVLLFSGPDLAAIRPDTPLLTLANTTVDRLVVEGDGGKKAVLKKQGDDWILPDHFSFPANKRKVEELLTRIQELKHGTAVATTAGALLRFKVTPESFERRITLGKGENTLATLFLGTSPGMRRVHARTDKDKAVFNVALATHDVPFQDEEWEEKEVLKVPEEEIEKVQIGDLTLIRQEVQKSDTEQSAKEKDATAAPVAKKSVVWQAEGLKGQESLKTSEVEKWLRELAKLRIGKVLGISPEDKYGLKTPKVQLVVTRKGKGNIEYQIGEQEGGAFVVKVSTRTEYFEVPKYAATPLVDGATRDKLVEVPKAVEPAKPAEPAKAVEPVQPAEPAKAVEPVQPAEPAKAVEPVQPAEPAKAVEPVPVAVPVTAVEPDKMAEPVKSGESTTMTEPVKGEGPSTAVEPATKAKEPVQAEEVPTGVEALPFGIDPVGMTEPARAEEPGAKP